jgi:hypothetical protein
MTILLIRTILLITTGASDKLKTTVANKTTTMEEAATNRPLRSMEG